MKQSIIVLFGLCCLLFVHCDLINPEEAVPAYIHIEPFSLQTELSMQGSASHKITEGWLTVNDEFLGVYQLPATVPVLLAGSVNIFLEAGIKDNGIGSTPDIYPFYQPYQIQVELSPNQTTTIIPTTRYEQGAQFAFIEDFETGTTIFQDTLLGAGGLKVSSVEPFEGNFSGKIELTTDDPVIELATISEFAGLTDRSPLVYLEVNYKSDVPVIFGLIGGKGTAGQNAVFDPGFNPKNTWNKIYFNLSGILATSPFDAHQVGLKAYIPKENGQLTLNSATVWLDNLKLVHF